MSLFILKERENAENDKLMKSMEKMIQINQSRNYVPGGEAIANFHPADILYIGNLFYGLKFYVKKIVRR